MPLTEKEMRVLPVPNWPGYRISQFGVVESCRTNGGQIGKVWRVRTPTIDEDGYLRLRLHRVIRICKYEHWCI